MLTKTIALAAVLFAGTATLASAQEFDPNLANRYPGYSGPAAATQSLQSAPVRLQNNTGNNASQGVVTTQGFVTGGRSQAQNFHYDSAAVISGGGY